MRPRLHPVAVDRGMRLLGLVAVTPPPADPHDVGEYLASLTAGPVRLDAGGGGGSGGTRPGDARALLKGALGRLESHRSNLLLAIYCQDTGAREAVIAHYVAWVRDAFPYRGGHLEGWASGCAKIVLLAVRETVDPPRCPACGGRGWVYRRGRTLRVTCPRCGGHAPVVTDYARARNAGIDRANWKRRWGPRFHALMRQIQVDHLSALAIVRWQLGWPRPHDG